MFDKLYYKIYFCARLATSSFKLNPTHKHHNIVKHLWQGYTELQLSLKYIRICFTDIFMLQLLTLVKELLSALSEVMVDIVGGAMVVEV